MTKATHTADSSEEPVFDVTELEGFIPIDEFKKWELPEFDSDNPAHVAFVETLANILVRVQQREARLPSEERSEDV